MIDGFFKRYIDPYWEVPARSLVKLGLSANQVTLLGLGLVGINCAAFALHGSTVVFGVGLALTFAMDSLDGAVARLRNECTHFGGYLDAIVDRYQEVFVFLVIAAVTGSWFAATFAMTGAFLTSYCKARAAIEMPIENDNWPDFFERLERTIFLCALLVIDGVYGLFSGETYPLVNPGLWIMGVFTHGTAIQRFFRARAILRDFDSDRTGGSLSDDP